MRPLAGQKEYKGKGGAGMEKKGIRQIAKNREASHEYFILEDFEAGIELSGTEV